VQAGAAAGIVYIGMMAVIFIICWIGEKRGR